MVQDFISARPKYLRDWIPNVGARSGPETRSLSAGKSRQSCVKARDPQHDARWVKMVWFQRNPRVITHGQILVQMAAKWTMMFMGCSTLARERPQQFSFSALATVVFVIFGILQDSLDAIGTFVWFQLFSIISICLCISMICVDVRVFVFFIFVW